MVFTDSFRLNAVFNTHVYPPTSLVEVSDTLSLCWFDPLLNDWYLPSSVMFSLVPL